MSNPELFIESKTERSWMDYLTNMSRQGTWADGIIIQAVPNSINIAINIAESNETFHLLQLFGEPMLWVTQKIFILVTLEKVIISPHYLCVHQIMA